MYKEENQIKAEALSLPLILTDKMAAMVFSGIFSLSFFVPFLLGHPQWLVGTIVNACLFLSAIFLPKKFFLPLIIFPSLGVLARGLVFGPFTPFLIYFLPFIWLGNLLLILAFKKFYYSNYFFAIFAASSLKYLFLFLIANIYFKLHFAPAIFLQAMGTNQLLTAISGGFVAYAIINLWKTLQKK